MYYEKVKELRNSNLSISIQQVIQIETEMIEQQNMEIAEFASNSVYSQQSKTLAKKKKGKTGMKPRATSGLGMQG